MTVKRLLSIDRLKEIARLANLSDEDASEFGDLNEAETWEALIRFHSTINSCEIDLYEYKTICIDGGVQT